MPDRNSKEESIRTELNRLSEKFSGDLDTDLGRRLLSQSIPSDAPHVLVNGVMAYIDQAIVTKTWSMEMKKARQTKELMTSYHISSNVPPIVIEGIANYILDDQPRISEDSRSLKLHSSNLNNVLYGSVIGIRGVRGPLDSARR